MDGFEGNARGRFGEMTGKAGAECRISVPCSLLAAGTAVSVVLSGLNGFVQIVKAIVELRSHW
ncbi:MAG: hypothetical protein NVSMB18_29820 [Acetobacteraceae bacterium]